MDVVSLTTALCQIPSITNDEAAVVDFVAQWLKDLGLAVTRQRVGDGTGRDNLLATVKGRVPEVLFTTHLDTVPPFLPPRLEGEWLYGRGVIDAKGIAAAMLLSLKQLLAHGEERVGVLFVVGEETNSDGAKAAAGGFAPKVKAFINGEPTDGIAVRAMKGVLAFELTAHGRAAHSAYPAAGHNAVHQLIDDLGRLLREPWPVSDEVGETTLNVGTIAGGVAANVLAPSAVATCVMRTTIDADTLLSRIRERLHKTTELVVKTKSSPQTLLTFPDEASQVVAFGSDVPHLTPLVSSSASGALLIGPGSILDAHTAHERVRVADLVASVARYTELAQRLLRMHPGT